MKRIVQLGLFILATAFVTPTWSGGGFAGGLAEGLQRGMQLNMQRQFLELQQQRSSKQEGSDEDWLEQVHQTESKQPDARVRIMKAMATTDLLDDPEKLSKMAAISADHGMMNEAIKFSELASQAKQRAQVEVMQNLMMGNVERAMDMARRGGTPFADRPDKVHPANPNDYQWRVLYEGSPETVINVQSLYETYARTAPVKDVAGVMQSFQGDQERNARMELMEEQKRALEEQRRRGSTSELRDALLINEMLAPRH
ncbi:hypothetical protein [Nitrosovibrio sp. Nv4]|uniref:hypothetical protein n=1 Tax=Nitrosovibrio sp. Nv4 TaxID=1945880 RepID=UPI000BD21002|nr:hypothetical protein [Nitrosovibrio sp. Nv4]SOD42410.1 hypothetical protein SAMN06298226_2749 [Nitrosovibrio sp. Nv4]